MFNSCKTLRHDASFYWFSLCLRWKKLPWWYYNLLIQIKVAPYSVSLIDLLQTQSCTYKLHKPAFFFYMWFPKENWINEINKNVEMMYLPNYWPKVFLHFADLPSIMLSVQVIMAVNGWNTGWREDTTTTIIWIPRRAPGWSQRASYKTTLSSTKRTSR